MVPASKNLLIVFAKPPIAGQAKTRLIPALGPQGAADLHFRLLCDTVSRLVTPERWNTQLWVASHPAHAAFQSLAYEHAILLRTQQGRDLGERMYRALAHSLENFQRVVLIGTDCPILTKTVVQEAFAQLGNHDVVFNPAEDGGYVLVGARAIVADLFEGIAWGENDVMQQTLQRLQSSHLTWRLGDCYWDVDTPEDLARYHALAMDFPVV